MELRVRKLLQKLKLFALRLEVDKLEQGEEQFLKQASFLK